VEPRLVSVLIPAVGGQGGGVLSEWIVETAGGDGLVAHGTSIPGVAQRTGSTSYYVEVYTGDPGRMPVFSLYPVPGGLDVLLAPEFLEVGRAIELGFPSPSRTTIITSTHRLYSIHEKITTAGSVYPSEQLMAGARAFSRRLHAFDALALAREHRTEANAILLGALAGSGALPVSIEAYRAAIERKGIQVAANLKGFELGLERVRAEGARPVEAPASLNGSAARAAAPRPPAPPDPALAGVPEALRSLVTQAVARLVDYQDRAYAGRYLERLRPFLAGDAEIARTVARLLAVWMTYEDAIRVADLKTRASRFDRIRAEARGDDVVVTDYLKPDLDEIYGILPRRLVAPFAAWAERRWPHGRPTLGQHVRTTTVSGFLRLWLLARCRWLRPSSYRAGVEHARIDRWLTAVAEGAALDVELGRELARSAQLVKGYGDVRRRMAALFDALVDGVRGAAGAEHAACGAVTASTRLAARARALALQGPEGEAAAVALVRSVRERLEARDPSGAVV
jgi:indolepyruvate ferredoxin oxidoreductase beta subunit